MTRRWRWILGWSVLTILVALAARGVSWSEAIRAASGGDPLWLALALLSNTAILVFTTWQWLVFVAHGQTVGFGRMFEVVSVTSSVSNGGPLLAGHAAGIHLLATRAGLGHAGGVSVTVLDQLAEGIAKIGIVALALLYVPSIAYPLVAAGFVVAIPLLFVGLMFVAHRREALTSLAERSSGRLASVSRFAAEAVHGLEALRKPSRFVVGAALGLCQKAAEGLAIFAVAAALGIDLQLWVVLASLVAVNLSTLVSVTPANLGVYEGSAFIVYRAAGLSPDLALALAVVQHALYLIPLAGMGWLLAGRRVLDVAKPG